MLFLCVLSLLIAGLPSAMEAITPSQTAESRKLTVYAANKSYAVAVADLGKFDYVSLTEVLEPLGKLQVRASSGAVRLTLNGIDGEFSEGKKLARIGRSPLLLPAKTLVDHGKLLVPLRALPSIVEK